MPSMPVRFWGDDDGERYRSTYFDEYPGIWRFGDWILFTERGSCVVTGRSDATLNRGGVRLGTGEFYAVVENLDSVLDSLVVHLEDPEGGPGELILFVQLADGFELDDSLRSSIGRALRGSPVTPPRAGHDRGRAGDPPDDDREEAGAAGQADPAGRLAGEGGEPGRAGGSGGDRCVRGVRRGAGIGGLRRRVRPNCGAGLSPNCGWPPSTAPELSRETP